MWVLGIEPGSSGRAASALLTAVASLQPSLMFCLLWFFETGFLCSFGACPGTHSVDQAGLPSAGSKGAHHHHPEAYAFKQTNKKGIAVINATHLASGSSVKM